MMKNELPQLDADTDFDKDMLGCLPVVIAAITVWALLIASFYIAIGWFDRPAAARDRGQFASSSSDMKAWFDGLRSGKGPCCSDADGFALSDVDWKTRDGGYRVRIPKSNDPADKSDMVWIDVPDEALISEPNRAGRTMVWPIWGYQGPTIRCFMPGSMI